jgi:uncharacterized protein YllA (UPF0747 family)
MTMHINPQEQLKEALVSSRLFVDWLQGRLDAGFVDPGHRDATVEVLRALEAESATSPAPLFQSSWVEGWMQDQEKDLPREEDRNLFRSQVASLKAGQADIVVTGQQPGFLGGPLYTLYKVATTIALARSRSLAGKPTVPVFWSGDDDDDLAEALHPVALAPGGSGLVKGPADGTPIRTKERPSMLGRRSGDPVTAAGAAWLERVARDGADLLAIDLAAIWKEALTTGWTWSRLARRSLLRVFRGTGLIVVSGDDPGLHAAASPLYELIREKAGHLAELAGVRGDELTSHGWHAQINQRSLKRPLFLVEDDRRVPWEPGSPLPAASDLRPGVMLRSPVQDWLLRPAAVVVGPGELAYLRQLDTVYRELGIGRPPLVPRLFAWLLPTGMVPESLKSFRERPTSDPSLAATLADKAENEAHRILENILKEDLNLPETRAFNLAEGRTRRWRKGVEAMLRDEIERTLRDAAPPGPEWVFPDGHRQERILAYLGAACLWGEDLVAACLEAAGQHLELGTTGNWREFVIEVPPLR